MPKLIKIPKVNSDDYVKVNFKALSQTHNWARVSLMSQTIADFKIPAGIVINVPSWWYMRADTTLKTVMIKGVKINELLKYLYIKKLREGEANKQK